MLERDEPQLSGRYLFFCFLFHELMSEERKICWQRYRLCFHTNKKNEPKKCFVLIMIKFGAELKSCLGVKRFQALGKRKTTFRSRSTRKFCRLWNEYNKSICNNKMQTILLYQFHSWIYSTTRQTILHQK